MDIRYARESDDLQGLWRICFAPEDGADFFAHDYDPARALVCTDDADTVCAMLHIMHKTLALQGEEIPIAYLLGIATHPGHRGRGLAADLIEQAFFELHLRGIPLAALIPGDDTLAGGFYTRFGFHQAGCLQIGRRDLPPLPPSPDARLDTGMLNKLYETACGQRPHVRRTAADWTRIAETYELRVSGNAYEVWDGAARMESSHPAGFGHTPRAACFKVISAAFFRAFASRHGLPALPSALRDPYCPWNGRDGAEGMEAFLFPRGSVYMNLLHNGLEAS